MAIFKQKEATNLVACLAMSSTKKAMKMYFKEGMYKSVMDGILDMHARKNKIQDAEVFKNIKDDLCKRFEKNRVSSKNFNGIQDVKVQDSPLFNDFKEFEVTLLADFPNSCLSYAQIWFLTHPLCFLMTNLSAFLSSIIDINRENDLKPHKELFNDFKNMEVEFTREDILGVYMLKEVPKLPPPLKTSGKLFLTFLEESPKKKPKVSSFFSYLTSYPTIL
jgi:hypothetical protein